MKKTIQANINGNVYYIDEDAYNLLSNYLKQIRSAFPGEEGHEIVGDIESRISELFDERVAAGAKVIVYEDVNDVIAIMGKPSDFSDNNDDQQARPDKENYRDPIADKQPTDAKPRKTLYRNMDDKVFGGVISGLAIYLGWDVTIMRVLIVILSIMTQLWPMCIIYLVSWMIIPPANTPRRVLEMRGNPVTVDTIGQSVLRQTPPPYNGKETSDNFFANLFSIIGKCIVGFFGLLGSVVALVATGFFIFFFVALIAFTCFDSITLLANFSNQFYHCTVPFAPTIYALGYMSMSLCFIIPGVALAWAAACFLFKNKGAGKTTILVGVLLEVLAIVATFILMIFANRYTHFC